MPDNAYGTQNGTYQPNPYQNDQFQTAYEQNPMFQPAPYPQYPQYAHFDPAQQVPTSHYDPAQQAPTSSRKSAIEDRIIAEERARYQACLDKALVEYCTPKRFKV